LNAARIPYARVPSTYALANDWRVARLDDGWVRSRFASREDRRLGAFESIENLSAFRVVGIFYLNFKVVRANSAKTSDAIQKRTMTLDSDHPINSK
jgi:hypothetical protein